MTSLQKLQIAQPATISCMLLALTACTPRPAVVLPPADLATCADEPQAPSLPERDGTDETQLRRDTMTLDYILALVGAGADCRAKVQGLKMWSDEMR